VLATRRIRRYLQQESRGRSQESFSRVLTVAVGKLERWASTTSSTDNVACVILIDEIMRIPHVEVEKRTVSILNLLSSIISQQATGKMPANGIGGCVTVLEVSSGVLGRLAGGPMNLTSVFVEFEIKRALEWLQKTNPGDMRRYAAVLVVKELAINAPALVNLHSAQFFARIFGPLCDKVPRIRVTAALALRHALRVIAQRERRQRNKLYNDVWSNARQAFPGADSLPTSLSNPASTALKKSRFSKLKIGASGPLTSPSSSTTKSSGFRAFFSGGNSGANLSLTSSTGGSFAPEYVSDPKRLSKSSNALMKNVPQLHGALLTLYELIGECTGKFIQFRFDEISDSCIWLDEVRFHTEPCVREAVMMILPRLALHTVEEASLASFLQTSLHYLIGMASTSARAEKGNSLPENFPVVPGSASVAESDSPRRSVLYTRVQSRGAAFKALGYLGTLNKAAEVFQDRLAEILEIIDSALQPSPKWPFCTEALECLRLLSLAFDIPLALNDPHALHALIPNLFNNGFSKELVLTLEKLLPKIGSDLPVVQTRLLHEITEILALSAIPPGKRNKEFQLKEQEKRYKQFLKRSASGGFENEIDKFISRRTPTPQGSVAASIKSSEAAESIIDSSSGTVRELWRDIKGRASGLLSSSSGGASSDSVAARQADGEPPTEMQILALRTLATFDFDGIDLIPLVVSLVTRHLDAKNPSVRFEASRACGFVLSRAIAQSAKKGRRVPSQGGSAARGAGTEGGLQQQSDSHRRSSAATMPPGAMPPPPPPIITETDGEDEFELGGLVAHVPTPLEKTPSDDPSLRKANSEAVQHILGRLIVMAMSDEDVMLRQFVIEDLAQRFTPVMLRNPEMIRSFTVLAHDQHFEVRSVAIEGIGMFASKSPARVMPIVNNLLIRLLAELNNSVESQHREESVVLIGLLIRAMRPELARPQISPIISSLLPKINTVHKNVATAMLATLGEVARVGDEATLSPLLARVLPIIVDILEDRSSSTFLKRQVALATLATMSSNAVLPIWPYFCFHNLLDSILRIMVIPNSPFQLRKQAMITYGVLGALDPWLYHNQKVIAGNAATGRSEKLAFGPELLLTSEFNKDLRAAVMYAYAADPDDSDGEIGSEDSEEEAEADIQAGVFDGTGRSFELDDRFFFEEEEEEGDELSPMFPSKKSTPGRKKIWGQSSRRTSYLVTSDIYASENSREQSRSSKTVASSTTSLSRQSSEARRSEPLGKLDPSSRPSLLSTSGGTGLHQKRHTTAVVPASQQHIQQQHQQQEHSEQNQEGGAKSGVSQHKRSATASAAAPAFQDTLARNRANRRPSLRIIRKQKSRRQSSIRKVAQQITQISQVQSHTRRQSIAQQKAAFSVMITSRSGANNSNSKGIRSQEINQSKELVQNRLSNAPQGPETASNAASKFENKPTVKRPGVSRRSVIPSSITVASKFQAAEDFGPQLKMRRVGLEVFTGSAAIALDAASSESQAFSEATGLEEENTGELPDHLLLPSSVRSNQEFYPRVAIVGLARILSNEEMQTHHKTAIVSMVRVFRSNFESGENSAIFLPLIMPRLVRAIQTNAKRSSGAKESFLDEFGKLIEIVKTDIQPYVAAILELIHEIFAVVPKNDTFELLKTVFKILPANVIEQYLGNLLDDVLRLLQDERDALDFKETYTALQIIAEFKGSLQEHLYLVVPTLAGMIDSTLIPGDVRAFTIDTLRVLCQHCAVSEYAAMIMHPLAHALEDCRYIKMRTLQSASSAASISSTNSTSSQGSGKQAIENLGRQSNDRVIFSLILETLITLIFRLEEEYAVFIRMIENAMQHAVLYFGAASSSASASGGSSTNARGSPTSFRSYLDTESRSLLEKYEMLVQRVLRGQKLNKPEWFHKTMAKTSIFLRDPGSRAVRDVRAISLPRVSELNTKELKPAWHTAQISTEDEWMEWMRRFSLALLRESPVESLEVCAPLAQVCEPLASELFNPAFLSCWDNLDEETRLNLIEQLELAMRSKKTPRDVLKKFLELIDFMEHDNKPLPIDIRIVSDVALRCRANAKALRYKEIEFRTFPADSVEKLISINYNLEQKEAAQGVVEYTKEKFGEKRRKEAEWLERLQKWNDAIVSYKSREKELLESGRSWADAELLGVSIGQLRCLNQTGGWFTVLDIMNKKWEQLRMLNREIGEVTQQHNESASRESTLGSPRCGGSPILLEEIPPNLQRISARTRDSSDQLSRYGGSDMKEMPLRRRSLDEGGPAITQPVGALIRNRSHASSSVVSYSTDEDGSHSYAASLRLKGDEEESANSPGSFNEQHPRSELANLFMSDVSSLAAMKRKDGAPAVFPLLDSGVISSSRSLEELMLSHDDMFLSVAGEDLRYYYDDLGTFGRKRRWQALNEGFGDEEDDDDDNEDRLSATGERRNTEEADSESKEEFESKEEGKPSEDRNNRLPDAQWYAQKIATIGAYAAYALGKWDVVSRFIPYVDDSRTEGCVLKVLLALKEERLESAQVFIDRAFVLLDSNLSSVVVEGYGRAYPRLVELQHMVELQEILEYKRLLRQENFDEAKLYLTRLRRLWSARLQGVKNSTSIYMNILAYRSMIIEPRQDLETWLHFCKIARKEKLYSLSLQALMRLGIGAEQQDDFSLALLDRTAENSIACLHTVNRELPEFKHFHEKDVSFHLVAPDFKPQEARLDMGQQQRVHPKVSFAYTKFLWAVGEREEALQMLRRLRRVLISVLSEEERRSNGDEDDLFLSSGNNKLRSYKEEQERQAESSSGSTQALDFGQLEDLRREFEQEKSEAVGASSGAETYLEQFLSIDREALDIDRRHPGMLKRLLVRCHTKLGSWLTRLETEAPPPSSPRSSPQHRPVSVPGSGNLTQPDFRASLEKAQNILECYEMAKELDGQNYKAWHCWALTNYRSSKARAPWNVSNNNLDSPDVESVYVVAAVQGFFKAIALGRESGMDTLQDTLRLLTLWFQYSEEPAVRDAVQEGLGTLDVEVWLSVIPQLIARLNRQGDLVSNLLIQIGESHPQVLLYPLTVASKSSNAARCDAARYVMRELRSLYPELVDEAFLISRELIRVAVLWHEKWYNRLEEASRHFFSTERNIDEMINILRPLHQEMEEGAETLNEVAFMQAHGLNLQEASERLAEFLDSGSKNESLLDEAWDLYYGVFREVKKRLGQKKLELRNVSPCLLQARNMQLAIPGTYSSDSPVVEISRFEPSVRIINSKQRPRVFTMIGSDGLSYMFLLKGNEDLRMDERVMQLFGLVNGLLTVNEETRKLSLEIQRYSVVPLSASSGIVEWVPNTDTLHRLIENYRKSRRIPVQVEQKVISEKSNNHYDLLCRMQKVEVFKHVLEKTSGKDIARVLWLKSPNSEIWVDRRTAYTRSLATMSMVGYILGLGDRHPSNLMLERTSGRILHIDFGDCFEVTMHRENFPETVPFRLTRMLVNAMEATGIKGNFLQTCNAVMTVLRRNNESILTILEAFVYDPLVSWRILAKDDNTKTLAKKNSDDTDNRPDSHKVVEDALNARSVEVINRVRAKLHGRDFSEESIDVGSQVNKLVKQAKSAGNLAQLYRGWSACW